LAAVPLHRVSRGNLFFAFENPLANNRSQQDRIRCSPALEIADPSRPDVSVARRVVGVARGGPNATGRFWCYVERERARPCINRFCTIHSWYGTSPGSTARWTRAQCLVVIDVFGAANSIRKTRRATRLVSCSTTAGMTNRTLWGFHTGFPNGFRTLKDAAAKHHFSRGCVALALGRVRSSKMNGSSTAGHKVLKPTLTASPWPAQSTMPASMTCACK